MSIIRIEDITDSSWCRDFNGDARTDTWYEVGLARWQDICRQYSIDETKIPVPAPWVPKRIATLCVLVACFADNLGSDFRAVSESYNLDVYKQKKDICEKELDALLIQLTPGACGYTPDEPVTGGSMVFGWARA